MFKNIEIEAADLWFYVISAIFIGLNAFFLLSGFEYFAFISLLFVFAWFALFAYDKIYFFIIFFTPLSIPLSDFYRLPFDLSMPAEAMMIVLTGILLVNFIFGKGFKKEYLRNPIAVSIAVYLVWMFYTSLTSSMPAVSFKFFLAKIWFIIPMYFFSIKMFENRKNIFKALWLYIIPFLIVIIYTIHHHLSYGLYDKQASHWVMSPFYNDHTSYGAMISMYLPVLFGFLLFDKKNLLRKIPVFVLLIIFSIALVLSYSRAAWISLVLALMLGLVIYFKIKFRYLLITGMAVLSVIYIYRFEIIDRLEKNRQDSSAQLSEHIRSVTNIATDASNLERLNRWNSAFRMFKEKPFLGWGPGTYMFQYAPFQMARDKTIISTNFGDGGTAHSEYLSALIDSGIPGLISFLLMVFFILQTGIKSYHQTKERNYKILIWSVLVGLISYLIHGFLNNFLDTDKASVPFWTFVAIISVLQIKNPQPGGAEDK
ncbi:MAG: O-antigen ligase family protein [Bacteroidales bacterium]|nr:O-antigen ligase family protein [Bacteroidales bacterium]